jgi:hypothetical protein
MRGFMGGWGDDVMEWTGHDQQHPALDRPSRPSHHSLNFDERPNPYLENRDSRAGCLVRYLGHGAGCPLRLKQGHSKNLLLHKAIAYLGMGAAFYALFLSRAHFSFVGWAGLAGTVIAIAFVGSMIHKYKPRPYREVIPSSEKKSRRDSKRSEKAKRKAKPTEIPSYVFVWTGGFVAVFWGLVLVSPLLWFFLGDERVYVEVVETYWHSFAAWYTNP